VNPENRGFRQKGISFHIWGRRTLLFWVALAIPMANSLVLWGTMAIGEGRMIITDICLLKILI
jgi:hypothetical protein